jgi:hypothetical protein
VAWPGGGWPNEPAGFKLATDYDFGDAIPQTQQSSYLCGTRWQIIYNSGGSVTRVTDSTAPFSSPYVVQFTYPTGMRDGSAPGTIYWDSLNSAAVYIGWWWKPSKPWQTDRSGTNKIAFLFIWGKTMFISMHNYGSHYGLQVEDEYGNTVNYDPNVTTTPITLGQWHRIEWYVNAGSGGLMKWWLDGALQGSYANTNFPGNFTMFQFSPTWGGNGGDVKTETDYYWYDHVHLSVP